MRSIEELAIEAGQVNRLAKTNIIDAFKAGAREAQRWISVYEELPKYGEYVLVTGIDSKTYGEISNHVCCMDDLEDGVDFYKNGEFYWLTENGTKIDKVTHWRPIERK